MTVSLADNEPSRLAALREVHLLDTAPEEAYDDITRLASLICGVPIAAVSLVDEHRLWFKSILGADVREIPREVSFCDHTIRRPDLMIVPDATRDERFAANPFVTGELGIRFYAGTPLVTSDGYALGALCVIDHEPRTLTAEQTAALSALGRQVVSQIELKRRIFDQVEAIAAWQQAEAALSQSEERYQRIVGNVPGVVYQFILRADGTMCFPFISGGCRDLFGIDAEAVQKDTAHLFSLIHPEDLPGFTASGMVSAESLEPWHWEGRIVRGDGSVLTAQFGSRPELQPGGDILWDGLVIDVSLRRAAEEALQAEVIERKWAEVELQRVLTQSEQIFASITSILITCDDQGVVTTWNAAAAAAFGRPTADVLGTAFAECGVGWDWEVIRRAVEKCTAEQTSVRVDDVRYLTADGRERFLGVTLNPINQYCYEPKGFLLLAADITGRRILEGQLAHAQKMESIGQLAAGIAHEINTPIQYVGDNTRFLRDAMDDLRPLMDAYGALARAAEAGAVPPGLTAGVVVAERDADPEYLLDEIPRAIRQSLEGIERVSHIVRAMKEFSHPGTDHKVAADLNQCLESTLTVARNEWRYVADLVTEFDPELPPVPCLPADLNQVFLNMIVNAAHAIADVVGDGAERKGTITVSTHRDGDCVEIRIGDTGTGMSENVKARVFDPFFTTKPPGRGTGQGLAISHAVVVEKHGGTITVETAPGSGTTFIIRLPLTEDRPDKD